MLQDFSKAQLLQNLDSFLLNHLILVELMKCQSLCTEDKVLLTEYICKDHMTQPA